MIALNGTKVNEISYNKNSITYLSLNKTCYFARRHLYKYMGTNPYSECYGTFTIECVNCRDNDVEPSSISFNKPAYNTSWWGCYNDTYEFNIVPLTNYAELDDEISDYGSYSYRLDYKQTYLPNAHTNQTITYSSHRCGYIQPTTSYLSTVIVIPSGSRTASETFNINYLTENNITQGQTVASGYAIAPSSILVTSKVTSGDATISHTITNITADGFTIKVTAGRISPWAASSLKVSCEVSYQAKVYMVAYPPRPKFEWGGTSAQDEDAYYKLLTNDSQQFAEWYGACEKWYAAHGSGQLSPTDTNNRVEFVMDNVYALTEKGKEYWFNEGDFDDLGSRYGIFAVGQDSTQLTKSSPKVAVDLGRNYIFLNIDIPLYVQEDDEFYSAYIWGHFRLVEDGYTFDGYQSHSEWDK